MARKVPCRPDQVDEAGSERRTCPDCAKILSTRGSMLRHRRTACKHKGRAGEARAAAETNRSTALLDLVEEQRTALRAQQDLMKTQHTRLTALESQMITVGGSAKSSMVVSGDNTQVVHGDVVNNNIVAVKQEIHINVFGCEDRTHITRGVISSILGEAQAEGGGDALAVSQAAVRRTGRKIYSERRENLTAYQGNKREKEALVRAGTRWEVRSLPAVVREMAVASINEIFDKQPLDASGRYDALLKALAGHEPELVHSGLLIDLLRVNKKQIQAALGRHPKAGDAALVVAT